MGRFSSFAAERFDHKRSRVLFASGHGSSCRALSSAACTSCGRRVGVRVMATGRSDFPNQVNNVLCFPGLFKGALSVRARDINDQMKLAAAYAIADLITDADRSEENSRGGTRR